MAPAKPIAEKKKRYFTVEEANKALPLVRMILGDIVSQYRVVEELQQRLAEVPKERRRSPGDPYSEELAQSQAEFEAEEAKLRSYIDELRRLGVEFKGPDGLCDFYSMMDGREVFLCWRLGEPEVQFWHDLDGGFAGASPCRRGRARHRPATGIEATTTGSIAVGHFLHGGGLSRRGPSDLITGPSRRQRPARWVFVQSGQA